MGETRKPDPNVVPEGEDRLVLVAATVHLARTVEALSDTAVAALHTARDAHAEILRGGADALGAQISAATALAGARTMRDLLAAQQEFGRRALRAYLLSAQRLRMSLVAGAKATKEPLLDRLR